MCSTVAWLQLHCVSQPGWQISTSLKKPTSVESRKIWRVSKKTARCYTFYFILYSHFNISQSSNNNDNTLRWIYEDNCDGPTATWWDKLLTIERNPQAPTPCRIVASFESLLLTTSNLSPLRHDRINLAQRSRFPMNPSQLKGSAVKVLMKNGGCMAR